jgi:hypothetical protein
MSKKRFPSRVNESFMTTVPEGEGLLQPKSMLSEEVYHVAG